MAKERLFQFKQFSVAHEVNAMKVCTEACILGAFAPVENKKRILDIGAGTGLLTLMSAQRSNAQIQGIELVKEFSEEACENVQHSPWSDRIQIINQSFESFADQSLLKFDLIISNPPFYTNQLRSKDHRKNLAWHSESFDHENFMSGISNLLTSDGEVCILVPIPETEFYIHKANQVKLFPKFQLLLKNRPNTLPFRAITIFSSKSLHKVNVQDLIIYEEGTIYSDEFRSLLSPFYTIF